MESILDLVTIRSPGADGNQQDWPPSPLQINTFAFRICDIQLPQCQTGFVYFLISVRTCNFTYIGECKCIISRLRNHNSGHGSSTTTLSHRRPYAIFGYIAGFNGANKSIRHHIEHKWKEKRDYLISRGIDDPHNWFRIGSSVIEELDASLTNVKEALRLVELFK